MTNVLTAVRGPENIIFLGTVHQSLSKVPLSLPSVTQLIFCSRDFMHSQITLVRVGFQTRLLKFEFPY